jgi:hypothetical protein
MQKRTFYALAAILIGSLTPVAAMPGNPDAIRLALEQLAPVKTVACYGFGWRGWGIYPGWYPACYPVAPVYAPGYVVAAPAYPPGRCWVSGSPDGRGGYWKAC